MPGLDPDDSLRPVLNRIAASTYTEADLVALRCALLVSGPGGIVQVGKYNIHIGEGQDVRIGDTVYQGPDAEAIREVLQQVLSPMQMQQERIAEGLKAVRAEMATLGRARAATMVTMAFGMQIIAGL